MTLAMGVGSSSHADVFDAGQEAAREAVSQLGGRAPDLILVFSSIRFADPRMLRAVRSVTGTAPLIGCSDAGSIITAGPRRRSVTVIGLHLGKGACVTAFEPHISSHPHIAGERLADALRVHTAKEKGAILLFSDGLTSSPSELLLGAQKKSGRAIQLAGACAGDDFFFQKTFQYFNEEVLNDAAVGVYLSDQIHLGIGVRHGWIPVGRPRKISRAEGRVVHQIDKRPAISIYEDFLGLKRQELSSQTLASMTLSYPLGMEVKAQSEYILRDAIRVGKAGSLICTGDVPEGSEVRLMIGGYESALEATQQAACDALEQLAGAPVRGGLIFSSVGRQRMLGSEFQGEIDVVRDALGGSGIRLGGFYSYGEMTSAAFHNESVVVVALG